MTPAKKIEFTDYNHAALYFNVDEKIKRGIAGPGDGNIPE